MKFAILLQPLDEDFERDRDDRQRTPRHTAEQAKREKSFRLSHSPADSEEVIREREHQDVKVFLNLSCDFCRCFNVNSL